MCGRFTLTVDPVDLLEAFSGVAAPGESLAPRYNIAPTQPIAVVANDGQNKIEFFRWGLIPSWAKDAAIGNRLINARAETLAEKPSFRAAYKKRRCLILADGFYEWRNPLKGAGEAGIKTKTPMHIRLKSGEPFAFAGLWEAWHSPEDDTLLSCAIITTEPNSLMEKIHNRMPVILKAGAYARWLDPPEQKPDSLSGLLKPYPASLMTAYAVSKMVNSPANDSPECVVPVK